MASRPLLGRVAGARSLRQAICVSRLSLGADLSLRRLQEHRNTRLRPIKLWLDDIEDIYKLLNQDESSVSIEADGFLAETPTDLEDLGQDYINDLAIERSGPSSDSTIDLRIGGDSYLWVYRVNNETLGIFHQLTDLLSKKRRGVYKLLPESFAIGLMAALGIAASFAVLVTSGSLMFGEAGAIAGGAIAFPLGFLGSWYFMGRLTRSIVIPCHKNSKPNFWQRNKDQILLQVLASLLGLVVGYILGSLT